MRPVLSVAATGGLLFLVYYLSVYGIGQMDEKVVLMYGAILQTVILLAKDCFGFYFGSSQGSANKAETIDRMMNGGGEQPPNE
jgi:hypothetical protein